MKYGLNVVFEEVEVLPHCLLEDLKALHQEVFLVVLGREQENVDDHTPPGFQVLRLGHAHVGDRHDDEFFHLLSRVGVPTQVGKHDGVKGL